MNQEKDLTEQVGNENPANEKLTEEDVKAVKKAVKKAQIAATEISPENQKLFEQMMKDADMPIRMEDKDFQCGKQELDVRHLNRANWRQMEFRQLVLNNLYTKQLMMSLTDITRLLIIICKKLGVEDVIQATDDVINEIAEKEKAKLEKQLNTETKKAD